MVSTLPMITFIWGKCHFSIEFKIDGIIENVKKLKIKMYGCDDISWLFYSNNEIEIIRKE